MWASVTVGLGSMDVEVMKRKIKGASHLFCSLVSLVTERNRGLIREPPTYASGKVETVGDFHTFRYFRTIKIEKRHESTYFISMIRED